ncbi:MAG: FG-GAP-like repeat-containing protein [Acidobacteriota bacterium]
MQKLLLTFSVTALLSLSAISQTPGFTVHKAHLSENNTVVLHGDLNGDGHEDLITIARPQWEDGPAGNFSSVLSNGDGTYKAPITYTFPSVNGGIPTVLADFNGDGKLDLAAPVIGQNRFYLYFGNGDGTFRARVTHYLSGVNPQMVTLGAADVNHDNKTDLLLLTTSVRAQSSDLQVLLANGDGTFRAGPTTHGLPMGDLSSDYPVKLLTGDFDEDSKADVALWIQGGGGFDGSYLVEVLSGNGAGSFTMTYSDSTAGGLLEAADVNGDGISDLISTATMYCHDPGCKGEQPFLIVFYGATNRQMQYAQIPTNGCPAAGSGDQIAIADFNGDHIPDIAFTQDPSCGQSTGSNVAILSGKGNKQFGPQTSVSNTSYGFEAGPFALRANSDTKSDLVYTDFASSSFADEVVTLLNQTAANFPTCKAPNAAVGINVCSPASSVSSPVNFAIGASGDTPMRKVEIWADGKKQAEQFAGAFSNYAFLNASLPLSAGSHRIVVYGAGWDNSLDSKVFTLNVTNSSCSAPTSAGVHICSPSSGSTVSSPVKISATGKVSGTLASMQVWIDGVKKYSIAASTINTTISVAAGTHRFAVLAVNTSGQVVESAVNATVQ